MTNKKLNITSIEDDISNTLNLTEPMVVAPSTGNTILPNTHSKTAQARTTSPTALNTEAPNTEAPNTEAPDHSWVKRLTIITALIWVLLVAGLLVAVLKIDANWQTYSALHWATIIGLILGPTLMIFVAGYALKQLAKISDQAYTLVQTADALSSPDETILRKSKVMTHAISTQVDQVNEKLNLAVNQLATMEEVIQNQTQALDTANQGSRETVDKINASVESQNATLAAMTASLDESMYSLSKNLTMHTDNLAKSVQIAEQKIKEARISVEGATAKINSASDIVRANTTQASATLSASHEDIKSLGDIIRQRSEELDEVYKKHAGELTEMIEHLRDEQTALGASMEERLIKMRDLSLSAQASAESLGEASSTGKETIEALASAASLADNAVKTRFSEMREMVEYSTEHAQSISDMAANRVQDSLELTRKEITRIEQEMADLQTRIGENKPKSLELVPDHTQPDHTQVDNTQEDVTVVKTDTPKTSKGKKTRTRLMLKPIIDIQTELEQTEIIEPEVIPEPEPQPISEPDPIQTPELETPKSELESQEQAPLELSGDLVEPDMIRQSIKPSEPEHALQQEKFPSFHPLDEAVRRSAPIDEPKKQKPKSKFFGGFFGKRSSTDLPITLDIVSTEAPVPLNQNPPPTDDEILMADLEDLGLSAHEMVDEGCIIEATNARSTSGHAAMSRCVAQRLLQPVEHLVKSLTLDDNLSDKAIIFATHFDRNIELLAGEREAIRTHLESEKGRVYLLCDAALNYGRV